MFCTVVSNFPEVGRTTLIFAVLYPRATDLLAPITIIRRLGTKDLNVSRRL
jgi:hypothetical protein